LTIAITTRNRPEALRRCLASIATALGTPSKPPSPPAPQLPIEVLVFDDNSDVPVLQQLEGALPRNVRVIRDHRGIGYIAGRNALVREASHSFVLLMDDDAVVLKSEAIERAVDVLERDSRVAAVAFAQAERDGRPWPEGMQPGRGQIAATVPSYIGFAHLIRRRLFLELGGYRDDFICYGEEKDLCLRLMDAGYRVVYLPDALVAHVVDRGERDQRRYVRFAIRNDCLMSLYNEPWPLVLVGLPVRLWRFRRMAASIPGGDRDGLRWIFAELRRAFAGVWRRRRPVSWTTIRTWRRLSRSVVPYEIAPRGSGSE
jgi:GT2 family glycosyltransferase